MSDVLYTVGHSNGTLEKLLSLIRLADANCIIDVRSTPASAYSPHFNKESLHRFLRANGVYMGTLVRNLEPVVLTLSSEARSILRKQLLLRLFFAEFRESTTDSQRVSKSPFCVPKQSPSTAIVFQ